MTPNPAAHALQLLEQNPNLTREDIENYATELLYAWASLRPNTGDSPPIKEVQITYTLADGTDGAEALA